MPSIIDGPLWPRRQRLGNQQGMARAQDLVLGLHVEACLTQALVHLLGVIEAAVAVGDGGEVEGGGVETETGGLETLPVPEEFQNADPGSPASCAGECA